MYRAHGPCAVQQREQRAEAGTAEDQRSVGIDPDLDLVRRALNDGRVRHQSRMLNWVMGPGILGHHGVSLRLRASANALSTACGKAEDGTIYGAG